MTISESFKRFQYFHFEINFLESKNFFQKAGVPFLVESSKIENTSFPFKTALSEANVKTNRMATTKWTYHKERSFASNYFIFWKFCFSLRTSYKELICCTNNPNAHICTFCKHWSFIWRCFSLWASLMEIFLYCAGQHFFKLENSCKFLSIVIWYVILSLIFCKYNWCRHLGRLVFI